MRPPRFLPLWLAACAILLGATLPRLAGSGMFLDGVTYAAIARNLALGQGSFWRPHYTATLYPAFFEQPPLGIWLESLAFRAAGDHLAVERIFSLLVALGTAACLCAAWRQAYRGDPEARACAWLPLALWAATPLASWGIVNNQLESVQAAFTTFAIWQLLRAQDEARAAAVPAVLAGAAVLAGCLAKGPVALFPLALPALHGFVARASAARAARVGALAAAVVAAGLAALWAWPEAQHGLGRYLQQQLVPGVLGRRELGAGRASPLYALGLRILLPMAGVALLGAALARGSAPRDAASARLGRVFLLTGLAASLPLVVSAKQADRYLIPSLPPFALGIASLALPRLRALALRVEGRPILARRTALAALALLAAVAGASALRLGQGGRDRVRIDDLWKLRGELAPGAIVAICPDRWSDWGLHALGQRLLRISLSRALAPPQHLLVSEPPSCPIPPGCERVPLATRSLALYRCEPRQARRNRPRARPAARPRHSAGPSSSSRTRASSSAVEKGLGRSELRRSSPARRSAPFSA